MVIIKENKIIIEIESSNPLADLIAIKSSLIDVLTSAASEGTEDEKTGIPFTLRLLKELELNPELLKESLLEISKSINNNK